VKIDILWNWRDLSSDWGFNRKTRAISCIKR